MLGRGEMKSWAAPLVHFGQFGCKWQKIKPDFLFLWYFLVKTEPSFLQRWVDGSLSLSWCDIQCKNLDFIKKWSSLIRVDQLCSSEVERYCVNFILLHDPKRYECLVLKRDVCFSYPESMSWSLIFLFYTVCGLVILFGSFFHFVLRWFLLLYWEIFKVVIQVIAMAYWSLREIFSVLAVS